MFLGFAGWAQQGPGRPPVRFEAPHEYTWLNAQSAELNAARAAARAGDAETAAAVYGCAFHWLLLTQMTCHHLLTFSAA